ncbi:hypothetical protein KEM54_006189 [Ascosphaera aggregata]|nr:hypothetical protein KEM54_006189 [Ascosphaera aggregata]
MTAISPRSLRSSTSTLETLGYPFGLHHLRSISPNLLNDLQLGMPAMKGRGGGKKAKQTLLNDFSGDVRPTTKANGKSGTRGSKKSKRKAADYEEDDGGFQFSRAAPKKKSRPSLEQQQQSSEDSVASYNGDDNSIPSSGQMMPRKKKPAKKATKKAVTSNSRKKANTSPANHLTAELPERLVNGRMLPGHPRQQQGGPLSGRYHEQQDSSPKPSQEQSMASGTTRSRKRTASPVHPLPPSRIPQPPSVSKTRRIDNITRQYTPTQTMANVTIEPTPQKIALPFADTPVMRKNKEMRMKNSKRAGGQRRSSLGMRGRRASSLIDSGASNALPHDEVRTEEFYKHIEGEGLPEPRRMRQLLTWCATRAIAQKPVAQSSEDQSAILAARIIQNEIIKEFSVRSELSDWFSREETNPSPAVVRRPNPKNEQNSEKIRELEAQIDRLRKEKVTLRSLMDPPSIPEITFESSDEDESISTVSTPSISKINVSLLDPTQQQLLESLSVRPLTKPPDIISQPESLQLLDSSDPQLATSIDSITTRLSRLTTSLLPTIDTFAAGIHDIELYRSVADDTAGIILKTCARKLEARDRARRAAAKMKDKNEDEDDEHIDDDDDEEIRRDDLAAVLGALSRVERREGSMGMA